MWFAFADDGHVYNLNGYAEKQLVATGAHGYATETQALQNPNQQANGAQAAMLAQYVAAANLPIGGGSYGVLAVEQVTQQPGAGAGGGQSQQQAQTAIAGQTDVKAGTPFDALASVGSVLRAFFDELTNAAMWKSLGWGVIGAVFLIVGIVVWSGLDSKIPPIIPV